MNGIVEYWKNGTMEERSNGRLEGWNGGMLGTLITHYSSIPIFHYSLSWVVELSSE
jgi:hypothetical protein